MWKSKQSPKEKKSHPTRRMFLQQALGTVALTPIIIRGKSVAKKPETQPLPPPTSRQGKGGFQEWYHALPDTTKTAIEIPLVIIGTRIAQSRLDRLLLRHLPPKEKKRIQQLQGVQKREVARRSSVLDSAIVTPLIEEALFRIIPSAVIDYLSKKSPAAKKNYWEIGVPLNLLFAGLHSFNFPPEMRKYEIPLSQFLGGCYLWYLIRQRGALHPIAAHAAYNASWIMMHTDKKRKK